MLGEPQTFIYPTGQRIYEQWTPLVVRGTQAGAGDVRRPDPRRTFAVWCDLATADSGAGGGRDPDAAAGAVQKLWDPGQPALSWAQFGALADRLG